MRVVELIERLYAMPPDATIAVPHCQATYAHEDLASPETVTLCDDDPNGDKGRSCDIPGRPLVVIE